MITFRRLRVLCTTTPLPDCCLGGFLVAFHERAGITETPRFDFRVPGVTSISADLHKYGLCPKGISLLLFSKHEYRKNIFFLYPHWLGGTYVPSCSSRHCTQYLYLEELNVKKENLQEYDRNIHRLQSGLLRRNIRTP